MQTLIVVNMQRIIYAGKALQIAWNQYEGI